MSDPGLRIANRYVLERPLGSGRGGSVFAATDTHAGTTVALKLLTPGAAARADGLDLERAGLRGLVHPHVVRILDAGSDGERSYVVSEFVAGGSLAARPLPLAAAWHAPFAEQMLEALAFLHGHGILHGDVKTENILVASDAPPHFKLADFGLAQRSAQALAGVRGSPAFMAPEVIRGEPADARSDLYALGVTLYECVFGELPFSSNAVRDILLRHLTEVPRRLASPGDLAPRLVALLRALLAKEPAARPAEARDALALWRGEEAALPRFVPARLGVLLGREEQMAHLEAARAGDDVAAIAIGGPPGIGKTRLLQEFALQSALRGAAVWWWTPRALHGGAAPETSAPGTPPAPAVAKLEMTPTLAAATESSIFPTFSAAAGHAAHDLAARRAAQTLAALGGGAWLLLVDDVDDAPQWFQNEVGFLLRSAAGDAAAERLVCIAGRQKAAEFTHEALAAGGFEAAPPIELIAWPAIEVAQASAALFGARQVQADLVTALVSATGGVPSEVESACQRLVEKKLLRRASDGALTLAAGTSVAGLVAPQGARVAAQLARCTAAQHEVLRTLALTSAPVPADLLAACDAALPAELPALQRSGLVTRSPAEFAPRFALAHAGIRAQLLEAMPATERRSQHDRLASVLERDPSATPDEDADVHRAHGSDLAAARRAVERLTQRSLAAVHPEVLLEACTALLELWPAGVGAEARAAIELEQLDLQLQVGDYDAVRTHVDAALAGGGEAAHQEQLRNRAVAAMLARGEIDAALEALGDASAASAEGPHGALPATPEAPETALLRARALWQRGENEASLAISEPLAASLVDHGPLWETALEIAARARRDLGDFVGASKLARLALDSIAADDPARHRSTLLNVLGLLEFYQGRIPEAEQLCRRAYVAALEARDRFEIVRTLNALAAVTGECGRYRESREYLRQALDLSRALGQTESVSYILSNMSRLATTLARYAEAFEHVDAALQFTGSRGLRALWSGALIERGELLATLGAAAECEQVLAQVLPMSLTALDEVHIALTRAGLALDHPDVEAARGHLMRAREQLESLAADDELVCLMLLESRLHALRGEREVAVRLATEAAHRAHELRLLVPRVQAHVWLASLRVADDPDLAEALARGAAADAGEDLLESRWRAEQVLAKVALTRGDRAGELRHYDQCVQVLTAITADLPPAYADSYLGTPERQRLLDEVEQLRATREDA
jgi:tetratricopeptide (TPR) repeat protein